MITQTKELKLDKMYCLSIPNQKAETSIYGGVSAELCGRVCLGGGDFKIKGDTDEVNISLAVFHIVSREYVPVEFCQINDWLGDKFK
jgi:hypothetical protein